MIVKIIFPKIFFSKEQLKTLEKYNVEFIEGKDLVLEKISGLFSTEDYILGVNPTYLKDNWNSFPIEKIQKMKGLKALCLTTSSFSWVDSKKMASMGIVVTNIPGAPTEAVAEFNILMMLSLLRKLPLIIKNDWKMDYDNFLNYEAAGLTVGIIGLGRIGNRTAELCRGLGMKVCYWNRTKKASDFESVTLDDLFNKSDVVFNTLATPPELKGFINSDLLSKLKNTAVIVSSSDVHVFDEEYVLNKVSKGELGGYSFESKDKKITDFNGNVMVFPEQAYYTLGTQQNRAKILTETITQIIENQTITNKVN